MLVFLSTDVLFLKLYWTHPCSTLNAASSISPAKRKCISSTPVTCLPATACWMRSVQYFMWFSWARYLLTLWDVGHLWRISSDFSREHGFSYCWFTSKDTHSFAPVIWIVCVRWKTDSPLMTGVSWVSSSRPFSGPGQAGVGYFTCHTHSPTRLCLESMAQILLHNIAQLCTVSLFK